jgi:hypothetical protein
MAVYLGGDAANRERHRLSHAISVHVTEQQRGNTVQEAPGSGDRVHVGLGAQHGVVAGRDDAVNHDIACRLREQKSELAGSLLADTGHLSVALIIAPAYRTGSDAGRKHRISDHVMQVLVPSIVSGLTMPVPLTVSTFVTSSGSAKDLKAWGRHTKWPGRTAAAGVAARAAKLAERDSDTSA